MCCTEHSVEVYFCAAEQYPYVLSSMHFTRYFVRVCVIFLVIASQSAFSVTADSRPFTQGTVAFFSLIADVLVY